MYFVEQPFLFFIFPRIFVLINNNISMAIFNPFKEGKVNVKKVNCDAVPDGLGDDPLRHQLEQSHHPGWQPCRLHRQVQYNFP
jgi:hypothetical protein